MNVKRSAAMIGVVILIIAALWYVAIQKKPDPTPTILKQIQPLSELVTVKYVVDKIVTHEVESIFGKDKILLVAGGTVKAGIDLSKMTSKDVRVSDEAISLHLPPSQVTDRYLDERRTFVYDRRTALFVRPDKHLESEARRLALGAMLASASANGILKDSDTQARLLITKLFQQLGYTKVEFH